MSSSELTKVVGTLSEKKILDTSWDFKNEHTKYATHGFHTYPAMMIPQIAKRLIRIYGGNSKVLLDPFMGSGTALVEATLHENFKKCYGIDINPLALLIAKVKTTPIATQILSDSLAQIISKTRDSKKALHNKTLKIMGPNFYNIDFWFKPQAIDDLNLIKYEIERITTSNPLLEKDIKDFFKVAFSETVRKVSNTRSREYKLYRINSEELKQHSPDAISEFLKIATKNIIGMSTYSQARYNCNVDILAQDTRNRTSIPDNSVDIIVTSPPYGDSRTTVAYGQFSRLALQWLGYENEKVISIDKVSLGGEPTKTMEHKLNSQTLNDVLNMIKIQDETRAKDVLSFYVDFNKCIAELNRVMKANGHLCFVVGNRTVKGVKIPTDKIITELFQAYGDYDHIKTYIRNIPHKRMPRINSPTNIKGNHAVTMNEEYVVILQKK
ncbi:MAG: site-specific DNA-methyltransferase [Nanoarchaeota archaeon]|nr:site-specific DNA-methyltransferase [Nanoarchaeota archaeon]